jgi:ATP adenylyltransferase
MGKITDQPPLHLLQTGTLWAKTVERTQTALACGALQPIVTAADFIEQAGIRFLVRTLANLARKEAATKQTEQNPGRSVDPFLPYDRDLFVADLSATHVCLLNKYNVVDHHLLIVTRAFEAQETLLTLSDFEALYTCLREIDGLGFYNSGKLAGASQPHKHLQLVPLPLAPCCEQIPLETALAAAWGTGSESAIRSSPVLPFRHALTRLNYEAESLQQAAQAAHSIYQSLLVSLDLFDLHDPAGAQPKGAYNLLMTRDWMLVVPRSQEQFDSIPVNALGFAGTLFVRNPAQLEQLKQITPLGLLQSVSQGNEPANRSR